MAKHVAFIIDHLGVGGVQEFLLNYCRYMSGKQHVTIVSIFGDDLYAPRLRAAGAEVIVLSTQTYNYLRVIDPRSFLAFRRFFRVNQARFDDIHLKLFASFAYASVMRLWRDARISAGLDANRNQLPLPIQALFWLFARHYRRFYLNSLLWKDYAHFGLGKHNLRNQIYPVTRRMSETPVAYRLPYSFISVGRGIPQKGHAEAVEFFEHLLEEFNGDACLSIIGAGPAIDSLKQRISTSIAEKVTFTGNVANYDDWLIGASGVIRMAKDEDINSVIREALLAGKAVATTLEGPGCLNLADKGLVVAIDRNDLAGSASAFARRVLAMTPGDRECVRLSAEQFWPDLEAYSIYE